MMPAGGAWQRPITQPGTRSGRIHERSPGRARLRAADYACRRFRLSCWDAAIIEASRAMGCTHVLSEDLNDGQDYGGVRVANPFR